LDIIANTWWPRIARRIFNKSEPEEQHLGSQLILGGAHPAKNMGDAPWPQTDVYTFSSPNFEPKKGGYRQILSIGAPDERYMKGVTKLVSNFAFLQSSIGGDFGPGSMLAHYLKSELEDAHLPGVSSLFQVGMASRRKVSINNFSEARFSADGDALQEDKFPPIACSYDEFVAICQSNGLGSSASLC
ncbi:MAG: hypothetical protein HYS66_00005, partial [Deltaproteobacteria bacterium]|nr:hypothetical protein [Deltaproteobacteria bacterium]